MRKIIKFELLLVFLVMPLVLNAYTKHAPIVIKGDNNFTETNGVVSGNGTEKDPYVIGNNNVPFQTGWEIEIPPYAKGITVTNTTKYFIIQDCYLHSKSSNVGTYGIYLYKAPNAKISYTNIENVQSGVTSDRTIESIEHSNVSNCYYGIEVDGCSIKNTTISNCYTGIHGNSNNITYCTISRCNGYGIRGYSNTIENCLITYNTYGVEGDACTIEECTISYNTYGIHIVTFFRTNNNIVNNCNIEGNKYYGLYSTRSDYIDVRNNWWNSPDGPGYKASKDGDKLEGFTYYDPWATARIENFKAGN